MGQIYLFETAEFLRTFETGSISTYCQTPYNWNRPCTFIDDETFVISLDNDEKSGYLDKEDLADYVYFQLAFFKTDAKIHTNKYSHRWIEPYRKVKCPVFTPHSEGDVTGLLFYDKSTDYLVALTHDKGAFAVSLDGCILENLTDVTVANDGVFNSNATIGWNYNAEHHFFYTWQDGNGVVEKRFPTQISR